jgi:hypothetical protein
VTELLAPAAPARPADDPFGRTAPKLGALLGVDADARVLLAGAARARRSDFEHHFAAVDVAPVPGARYGLAVWELADGDVADVAAALLPTGSLFLVAANQLGLRAAARDPRRLTERGAASVWGWRNRLRRAGFSRLDEFVPLPEPRGAEEFVHARAGEISLPTHASRTERMLNGAGLLPLLSDGYACIASGPSGGTRALLAGLGERLGAPVQLERFDLRDRGALVLLVRAGAERFVCRVTVDDETDRVVSRNAEWTRRIRENAALPAALRALVPAPRGRWEAGDCTQYVEERVAGVVAWKRAGIPQLREPLFAGVYGFVRDFGAATAERARLDEHAVTSLLGDAPPAWVGREVAEPMDVLRSLLRYRALGRERTRVWAHGDFGFGNAMVDPRTGVLRGIIDWDQARIDLAGVDLLNFLVQREMGARACSFPAAFNEVAGRVASSGFRAVHPSVDYEERLGIGTSERRDLVGWVALRMAERAIRYPRLFDRSRAGTGEVLRRACEVVSA